MNTSPEAMRDSVVKRWSVLLLVSFAMATNYYFYDALSPLKEVLTVNLGFDSSDYGFFVSAYSIPNVFLAMAIIGGIILDRIGIRITGTMFFGSMVLGSFLTYYGSTDAFNQGGFGYEFLGSFWTSYSPALKMMSIGYFLFGLGAETGCVVISKAVVKWFKGKELALALGLNISIARMGMLAALMISPRLIEPTWNKPIFVGFALLAAGLLAFLVYAFIDKQYDKQAEGTVNEADPSEAFKFSDLGKLLTNTSFIFIALLCVTFYSAVFPFVKYAPDMMVNKFGFELSKASDIVGLLPIGTMIMTPIFGFVCDFKGKSATLMILGSILLICVHLMFALTTITPYVPMIVLGFAFSLVPAAMWPSLAKIVPQKRLGTAYGAMFSIQNIGLWAFPMLIGYVLDASNPGVAEAKAAGQAAVYDYTNPVLMLAGLGVAGLIFAFLLKAADIKNKTGLELPNKVKEDPAAGPAEDSPKED